MRPLNPVTKHLKLAYLWTFNTRNYTKHFHGEIKQAKNLTSFSKGIFNRGSITKYVELIGKF